MNSFPASFVVFFFLFSFFSFFLLFATVRATCLVCALYTRRLSFALVNSQFVSLPRQCVALPALTHTHKHTLSYALCVWFDSPLKLTHIFEMSVVNCSNIERFRISRCCSESPKKKNSLKSKATNGISQRTTPTETASELNDMVGARSVRFDGKRSMQPIRRECVADCECVCACVVTSTFSAYVSLLPRTHKCNKTEHRKTIISFKLNK